MENNNYAHMEPSKEMLGLSMLEKVKLANESGQPSGDFLIHKEIPHWNEPSEPYVYEGNTLNKENFEKVIRKYIPEEKPRVATGRKAGKEKKTFKESLKFQQYVKKLTSKRDEVNYVESIIDERKNLNHSMNPNTAVSFLNPMGNHFFEEALIQDKLRKIQGLK